MDQWVWPAYIGVLLGAVLFGGIMVPVVMYQYRRYGRFTWLRLLGAAGVSIYATAILAYTMLPLPNHRPLDCPGGWTAQLVPFHFVGDIAGQTAGLGLREMLTSRVVLQVVFNVVLFIPWGIIGRRFFGRGILATSAGGLLASVLIEATQFTGVWGLYGCSYRFADVDDLMANTLGAVIGALIAPLVLWFMPEQRALAANRLDPRPVTVWRRWLGMVIDLVLLGLMGAVVTLAYQMAVALATGGLPDGLPAVVSAAVVLLPGLAVFYLPAIRGSGASLGQRAVWLVPVDDAGSRPTLARRLRRASVVGGLYVLLSLVETLAGDDPPGPQASTASGLLLVVALVSVPFSRGRRGLSGRVAGLRLADARTHSADAGRREAQGRTGSSPGA